MPKFKGRSTSRGDWSEENMKRAIQEVLERKSSQRVAADRYHVPRTSLQDRVKAIKQGHQINLKPKLGRFQQTFTPEFARQLCEHVIDLDNRLMPLTRSEFLRFAFDLAEKIKIPHRFNKEKRMAGKDFFCNFKKRNPDLALRTLEATSLMRAVGFNKFQVDRFYDLFLKLEGQFRFQASQIYNADETGVSTVHKNDKVLSVKGKKQVGELTSAERGRNVTVMFAMNAAGHFVPPMFIFPRIKMDKNGRLMIGAPPESIGVACKNSWMNAETFLRWLQHFQQHVHSSAARPILLILDGHSSHKELNIIEYARNNHIHMLSTPPHTTHKLQPLDRVFFKPFKQAYGSASASWMRQNPGARLTEYDIAGLVNTAFTKVARLDIAQNGFRCTGIQPFDRDIFSDLDFLGSALTDIPLAEDQANQSTTQASSHTVPENETELSTSALPETSATLQMEIPSTSANVEKVNDMLKILSPLPDASKKRLTVRKRRTQKSQILTSSPYKNELVAKTKDPKKMPKITKNIKNLLKKKNPTPKPRPEHQETECIICGETFDIWMD
ncbi:uncharacterized protein [Temnothorax longispinosus]|uniref:uncharacterized protein n=1 Tax=Temnothorax longispinosus TaxID=300112 RepID=UPI003A9935FA